MCELFLSQTRLPRVKCLHSPETGAHVCELSETRVHACELFSLMSQTGAHVCELFLYADWAHACEVSTLSRDWSACV